MLAKICQHYGLGSVVAIDPHNFNNAELQEQRTEPDSSTFQEFQENLRQAGVSEMVDVRRAYSHDVAAQWRDPIRFLWIDGDHSWAGAKADFADFFPYLLPDSIVALHDALHEFAGPIRVFVEEMLRSDKFGASGFVHSIAWSQFRPEDGAQYAPQRASIERYASRLIPFLRNEEALRGLNKICFKLHRARVPRQALSPDTLAAQLNSGIA